MPPVSAWVIISSVSRLRRTRSAWGTSAGERSDHDFCSAAVASMRSSKLSGSGISRHERTQVVEKVSSSPADISNSSLWWPSLPTGRRGPRRTNLSGPATATTTSLPCATSRVTHGRTLP